MLKKHAFERIQSISSRLVTISVTGIEVGTENGTKSYEKHKSDPEYREVRHPVIPPFTSPSIE